MISYKPTMQSEQLIPQHWHCIRSYSMFLSKYACARCYNYMKCLCPRAQTVTEEHPAALWWHAEVCSLWGMCLSWVNSQVNRSVSPVLFRLGSLTNRALITHYRSHLNKHNRQHRVQDHHAALSVFTLQMQIHQLLSTCTKICTWSATGRVNEYSTLWQILLLLTTSHNCCSKLVNTDIQIRNRIAGVERGGGVFCWAGACMQIR